MVRSNCLCRRHDDAFGLPTTSEWVSHVKLTRGQWRFALTGKLITSLHLMSQRSKLLAPQQAEIGRPGFLEMCKCNQHN